MGDESSGLSEVVNTLHKEGIALLHTGQFSEALEKFEQAAQLQPNNIDTLYHWGESLINLKRYKEANKIFETAHKLCPSHVDTLTKWGWVLDELKLYEEACEKYEQAYLLEPEDSETRVIILTNWGLALERLERLEEACLKYEQSFQLQPTSAPTLMNWSTCLTKLGRLEEACEKFEKAYQLLPNHPGILFNWGNTLEKLGRIDEAIERYELAHQLIPEDFSLLYFLCEKLFELRRFNEACKKYEKAYQLQPNNSILLANWGLGLTALGRHSEAIEKYEAAFRIQPDFATASTLRNWGVTLKNLGRYEEAIEKYRHVSQLQPDDVLNIINWGNVLQILGQFEEALEKYDRAYQLQPEGPNGVLVLVNWSAALAKMDRLDEAVNMLKHALELQPDDFRALENLGWILPLHGQYNEACKVYKRMNLLQPKNPFILKDWGNALEMLDRKEEAREKYSQALGILERTNQLQRNNPGLLKTWGQVLNGLELYELACKKYEYANQLEPNDVDILFHWGVAMLEQKQYEAALEKLEQADRLQPNNPQVLDKLKIIREQVDQESKVTVPLAFNEAETIDPLEESKRYEYRKMLTKSHQHQPDPKKLEQFKQTYQDRPDDIVTLMNWGDALFPKEGESLFLMKWYAAACEQYERAHRLCPTDISFCKKWKEALRHMGRFTEAAVKKKSSEIDQKLDQTIKRQIEEHELPKSYEEGEVFWIDKLHSEDELTRLRAVRVLGAIGRAQAVKPLIQILQNFEESDEIRSIATWALGQIKNIQVIEPLLQALDEQSNCIHEGAAWALGQIGEPAFELLCTALQTKSPLVRKGAAKALEKIAKPQIDNLLIQALRDKDSGVRAAAAGALGHIHASKLDESQLDRMNKSLVKPRIHEIGPIADSTLDSTIQELQESGQWPQEDTKSYQENLEYKKIFKALLNIKVASLGPRQSEIGLIDESKVIDPLIQLLQDRDEWVQAESAWALGHIGHVKAFKPLKTALSSTNPIIREIIGIALHKIKSRNPWQEAESHFIPFKSQTKLEDSRKWNEECMCISCGTKQDSGYIYSQPIGCVKCGETIFKRIEPLRRDFIRPGLEKIEQCQIWKIDPITKIISSVVLPC